MKCCHRSLAELFYTFIKLITFCAYRKRIFFSKTFFNFFLSDSVKVYTLKQVRMV